MQRKIKEKITKARIKAKVQKKEVDKVNEVNLRRSKDSYVFNYLTGEYWLAEYNLIAMQVAGEHPRGTRDGSPKTNDLLRSEAMLFKLRAEKTYKYACKSLMELKEAGLTDLQIDKLLVDFQTSKIKQDQYDLEVNDKMSNQVKFG